MTSATDKPDSEASATSGYRVTVTRTLTMIGRYRSPESAREFVLELADSGQLTLGDREEIVTVEPLEVSDADAARLPPPGRPDHRLPCPLHDAR